MRGDGVKRFRKPLCIGLLLGALELGAAGLLAGVGRLASFTDLAFGLGVATLLFGLLLLLGGRHRHGEPVQPHGFHGLPGPGIL